MDFQTFVAELKQEFQDTNTDKLPSCLAIQINVTGEGGGSFYIEVKDGKLSIEPFEYNDREVLITISQSDFLKLVHGQLDPVGAFMTGKLKAEGDLGKALELKKLIR